MTADIKIAEVAALIGDPRRAHMLTALMGGRAMTATELADVAGVTAPTASGHLAKLARGGLLSLVCQGRHRYFRLASLEVARMLEGIMVVVAEPAPNGRAGPRVDPALREARTCYDHLAGRLGVALTEALVTSDAVVMTDEAGQVTEIGKALLQSFGIPIDLPRHSRRMYCRPCLDWSERRPHLAGVLGAALLDRTLALGWISRAEEGRAVLITHRGRRGFADVFGVRLSVC